MLFEIRHATKYKFSKSVFLEPHTIRLFPRNDLTQKVHDFQFHIDPEYTGKSKCIDLEGNNTFTLWFEGKHNELKIDTKFLVEVLRDNPFGFIIIDQSCQKLPLKYPGLYSSILNSYTAQENQISPEIREITDLLLKDSEKHTLNFLSLSCSFIHKNFQHIIREKGDPYLPEETLRQSRGSCRDLTLLYMEICRSVGLAARFVSGYKAEESDNNENNLHAWAEIYLPGAGWKGFDPSLGLAVSNTHIALASGYNSHLASPLSGSFRGNNVKTNLDYEISIKIIDNN